MNINKFSGYDSYYDHFVAVCAIILPSGVEHWTVACKGKNACSTESESLVIFALTHRTKIWLTQYGACITPNKI